MITVTKKHPLYEKKKALTEAYGYEPPSVKVELEDFKNKSGEMYEWSKDDLDKALAEDTEYTYDFDTQEEADEFEASYQDLLKETDEEKQFNLTMQNLPNYGRDWQYSDIKKEPDYTKNENLVLFEPTAEQERPLTNAEVVAALATLKTPNKKYSEKTSQEKQEDFLKMFGGGE